MIAANAARLGLVDGDRFEAVVADATQPPFAPASFDAVLLDAPCSGLGALRRRPDARWRIQPSDIDDLAALQRRILAATGRSCGPAGGSCTASAR